MGWAISLCSEAHLTRPNTKEVLFSDLSSEAVSGQGSQRFHCPVPVYVAEISSKVVE